MIDGHGDDLFRFGKKIKINFSTNIPQAVDHSGLLTHPDSYTHQTIPTNSIV